MKVANLPKNLELIEIITKQAENLAKQSCR